MRYGLTIPNLGEHAAGATWWLEHLSWKRAPLPELRARVAAGPPA